MPGEWVSVREAARRLGISPETVRRRIEAGELVGEREAIGGSRERFRVRLDASERAPDMQTAPSNLDATETPQDAPALTTRLVDTVLAQAERIAALEREAGTLQGRVETLQAGIEQYILDQLEQTERAHRAEASLEASNAELRRLRARPWWRRLWHG